MATRISTAARTAGVTAIAGLPDAGAAAAYVTIRDGGQPAGPGTAPTGTLLATITLNDPAFDSIVSGVATADVSPVPTAAAVATGVAGWFRLFDSNNVAILDGLVGAEMTLNSTSIVSGVNVRITSFTVTMPAS